MRRTFGILIVLLIIILAYGSAYFFIQTGHEHCTGLGTQIFYGTTVQNSSTVETEFRATYTITFTTTNILHQFSGYVSSTTYNITSDSAGPAWEEDTCTYG